MERFDVQARFEYARAAVAVLRALEIKNLTMSYSEFARAIGLIADGERWHVKHRKYISNLLYEVAAVEKHGGRDAGTNLIQFDRVTDRNGQPGAGLYKTSRIVTKSDATPSRKPA